MANFVLGVILGANISLVVMGLLLADKFNDCTK